MKAIEQYFHVVLFIMLCKVVLNFKSVDETLACDYSSESSWPSPPLGSEYYAVLVWRQGNLPAPDVNSAFLFLNTSSSSSSSLVFIWSSSSSSSSSFAISKKKNKATVRSNAVEFQQVITFKNSVWQINQEQVKIDKFIPLGCTQDSIFLAHAGCSSSFNFSSEMSSNVGSPSNSASSCIESCRVTGLRVRAKRHMDFDIFFQRDSVFAIMIFTLKQTWFNV